MRQTLKCRAILFDMDGTLVDSTAIVEKCWKWWAERHHLPLEDVLRFSHGRPSAATLEHFLPGADHSAELREISRFEEADLDGVVPIPGATEAVRAVNGGRWALVTSADTRLAQIRMAAAGFPAPEVLVAADQLVGPGKPDPEGYLRAAELLGVSPGDCLVFEDTGPGVRAGLNAGMQVVALLTTVAREELPSRHVIGDFRDVTIHSADGWLEVTILPPPSPPESR